MIERGTGGPQVRIEFTDEDDRSIVRHWYHVPREGDSVLLIDDTEPSKTIITGVVRAVRWNDDGSAAVFVS